MTTPKTIKPAPFQRPSDLLDFDPTTDPKQVLGNRWLCKGGSCLFAGPSGVGKSSLAMELAIYMALGLPLFGIKVHRPLKSLFIQAENDDGDMAEALQGVVEGVECNMPRQEIASIIEEKLVFIHETVKSGAEFANFAAEQIAFHKPDVVWIDPLLSYLGADACDQEAVSDFLRHRLHPIAQKTGIIWMILHHTGKPPKDSGAKSSWTIGDFAYAGLGTCELTNYPRAICVLQTSKAEDGSTDYGLILAKRGNRTGATHPDGTPTKVIHLKQAERGIFWHQVEAPDTPTPAPKAESLLKGIPSPVSPNILKTEISNRLKISEQAAKMRISRMLDAKVLTRTAEGYTHAFGPASEQNQATFAL